MSSLARSELRHGQVADAIDLQQADLAGLVAAQKLGHVPPAVGHDDRDDRRLAEEVERAGDDVAVGRDDQARRRPFARRLISAAADARRDAAKALDPHQRRLDLGRRGAEGLGGSSVPRVSGGESWAEAIVRREQRSAEAIDAY